MIPSELATLRDMADVHIFDVDHTLTRHSTGRRFAQVGFREGVFTFSYLLTLPLFYLRYRLGNLDIKDINREIKPLSGRSSEEIERIIEKTWHQYITDDLYCRAVEYIRSCREAGKTVILASTSFDLLLRPLARYVGADETIASVLEFIDGRATGWLTGGPCYARSKADRIAGLLSEKGLSPERCAFYTDSFHDMPSLELVGSPVVVHPDVLLRRMAIRRAWPRISFAYPQRC
jgi:HAD superfamily hydrolase (TIGR01490 family)